MADGAQTDGSGPDERPISTEGSGNDLCPDRVLQGSNTVDFGLGGDEKLVAVPERDRTGDHRQPEIQQVGDGANSPTNHRRHPRSLSGVGLGSWSPGSKSDGGTTRLPFEDTTDVPGGFGAVRFDDDVPDMARISSRPIQKASIEHNAPTDSRRDDHAHEVAFALGPAAPTLRKRKRLGVIVDEDRHAGVSAEPLTKREVPPCRDIQRRHLGTPECHRSTTSDTAETNPVRRTSGTNLVDQRSETIKQRVAVHDAGAWSPTPLDDSLIDVDDADVHLCAADVDRQDPLHVFTLRRVDRRSARPQHRAETLYAFSRNDQGGGFVTTTSESTRREASSGNHGASPGFADNFAALTANVGRAIKGKPSVIHLMALALVAEGHVLVEDVPGVGKTSIGKAFARSVDGRFGRVQFTPDLLPTDVTGVSVWNRSSDAFEFRPGPVFSNVLLADEINRASPKTQSALLEAMAERQVTADGVTHRLPTPFMVIATQNPIEHEGTYALPEAQLDRFLMRLEIGYPGRDAELEILQSRGDNSEPADQLQPVLSAAQISEMAASLEQVYLAPALQNYLLDLAEATRRHPGLSLGLSPRGVVALQRVVRAHAAAEDRTYATPDDVKRLARHVMPHRLLVTPEGRMRGTKPSDVVTDIIDTVPVPRPGNG